MIDGGCVGLARRKNPPDDFGIARQAPGGQRPLDRQRPRGEPGDAFGHDSVGLALLVGFAAWLTFSATTLLQHNAFELKPRKLTLLNCAYQLVLFLAMALVIGLF